MSRFITTTSVQEKLSFYTKTELMNDLTFSGSFEDVINTDDIVLESEADVSINLYVSSEEWIVASKNFDDLFYDEEELSEITQNLYVNFTDVHDTDFADFNITSDVDEKIQIELDDFTVFDLNIASLNIKQDHYTTAQVYALDDQFELKMGLI